MDDNALFQRRHAVIDRMSTTAGVGLEGVRQWARKTDYGDVHAGSMIPNKAGRAIGRVKDDGRIVGEIDQELSDRGYSAEEVEAEYRHHCEDAERAAIAAAEEAGDDSFDIREGEVSVRVPPPSVRLSELTTLAPAVAAEPRAPRRDRLAWVAVMQELSAAYATGATTCTPGAS